MKQPFISIIMTVLNGGKTLEKSLESIENQLFDNYEVIMIDGGSTDNTLEIFQKSKIKDKTNEVLRGANIYQGLNRGIERASGQWLYFMGCDDQLYDNSSLMKIYKLINENKPGAKVYVGKVECIKQEETLKPLLGSLMLLRHRVHHQGMFYDATLFCQKRYDESKQISSDYKFNLELSLMNIKHLTTDITVCKFGGEGVSEIRINAGYREMQLVHNELFNGFARIWIKNLFLVRRAVGAALRRNNLRKSRFLLKRIFG